MKLNGLPFLALFLFAYCTAHKSENYIRIEGRVENIPDGKIYLTEAHDWKVPLDSTICRNGHFVFDIKPDSSFYPYMAAIHFFDSTKSTKTGGLFYRNHTLGPDSLKYSGDGFYLEKGLTRIEGNNLQRPFLRVYAGRETEIMYKNQFTDFGWLGNADSAQRLQRIAFFKKEIKRYPFSYFLLQSVYDGKEQYAEQELNEILSFFNTDVQASKLGDKFRKYLVNRVDDGKPYPNLRLQNTAGSFQNMVDPNAELNMIVFWASWCGPCRMEIPVLKKIEKEYKGRGLTVVSVSIDKEQAAWLKAIQQEKMPWPQLLIKENDLETVKQQFNFSAIPFVVFTDKNGKQIARFTGYEKDGKTLYESVIKKFIQ